MADAARDLKRLTELRSMLTQWPTDPFIHYAIGLEYQALGDNNAAAEWMEKALQCDPHYIAALRFLGTRAFEMGHDAEALSKLTQAHQLAVKQGKTREAGEIQTLLDELID